MRETTPASPQPPAVGDPAQSGQVARLCDWFLRQWPDAVRGGNPTAIGRAVVQEVSELPDPAQALLVMATYAVALDTAIQDSLRAQGKTAYSRFSRECDRHAGLGFPDEVVDACCVLIETLRTGTADRQILAGADRHGYRALSCLTSMCAHLAEALVLHSDAFGQYTDVLDWLAGTSAGPEAPGLTLPEQPQSR